MNWFKRWKAKNWDEQPIQNDRRFIRYRGDWPPLRETWEGFAKIARENPMEFVMAVAAVVGALAAVIALIL